jgi:hypothetical protein
MLNRRKAMIGWLVYSAAKPFLKQAVKDKAKGAAPNGGGKKRRAATIVAAAAAAAGALAFWRSRKGAEPGSAGAPGESAPTPGESGESGPKSSEPGVPTEPAES